MFAITAQRRGGHWLLHDEEKRQLADATARVLDHVPLPERELGIAADLMALGFVAYATVVPRLEIDKAVQAELARRGGTVAAPSDNGAVSVPVVERIDADATREHVQVGDTEPDLIERIDAAMRESGASPQTIGEVFRAAGVEGTPLDHMAPPITAEGPAAGGEVTT